jgi:hypothetical protein
LITRVSIEQVGSISGEKFKMTAYLKLVITRGRREVSMLNRLARNRKIIQNGGLLVHWRREVSI